MKLTRLELSGFKSFADTVTLDFEQGVTAIVGPNGCGKSNVSDAVRWVLGEQSARLLRGGKMEDVIFQGSANRRPVNVTEVALYLDNSDGDLPIAYREVVIARRLSRSGQSDYLLNGSPVRLRDIQDLLRGTGLGSDAGVVIESEMIKLLLSDRADERRSLFEEAAGIGLYRDRKHSSERRLEETAADLQRVEDLIAEVQSQIRSLARQKGKSERHAKLTEEKFAVQITLARRQLDELAERSAGLNARFGELTALLPAEREQLSAAEARREELSRGRAAAELQRTEIARRLGAVRVDLGKLDGDLALAAERLANTTARRARAEDERAQMVQRAAEAAAEREAAAAEQDAAAREHERIQADVTARAAEEETGRARLLEQRAGVRQREHGLHVHAQTLHSLEGERAALEGELASLRERLAQAGAHSGGLEGELGRAERERDHAAEQAASRSHDAIRAAAAAEHARHLVAEAREHEATNRSERRRAEEALAQITARREVLEELERDRVGLAPGAAALLSARDRFDGRVLGPLSDFVSAAREDAELGERLLGEWTHAVLVKDHETIDVIRAWHAEHQPGALVLLPVEPGPSAPAGDRSLAGRFRAEGPAAAWVAAALAGSEVLDDAGHVLRRASGAIFLGAPAGPSGPLRRRAELAAISQEAAHATGVLEAAEARLAATVAQLAELERAQAAAGAEADACRDAERQAIAAREDAARFVANLSREFTDSEAQVARLAERLARAEQRLVEVDALLIEGERSRARLDEALGAARAALAELETAQELAREQRAHRQVEEAHVAAGLRGASERLSRALAAHDGASAAIGSLTSELAQLEHDAASLGAQQLQWQEARSERRVALLELEAADTDAELGLAAAEADLAEAERAVAAARAAVDAHAEESHRHQIELTEGAGLRRGIVQAVETEWRKPIDLLMDGAALLDLDRETLESESARIVAALEAIGPVNPLAVEEHADEVKRLEFLTGQRDDLVGARQALLQAIREIDGTARRLFLETFEAVKANFHTVFQTLFGGGECDLRLANTDDPLESEIEILAAPRGKRIQHVRLLSMGERTLVATSLLFGLYLTKPSPFCLMDEVDAPLDDANVGRFTRLLDEFKASTQFIVITHNPRTMQAADAVFGVTMQEPGISTIVGVRLGEAAHVEPVHAEPARAVAAHA
ncbi:MAG TPA: chromosome segregation protein SMC [Gemmatimonadales bacterium]|nr:chromosome segregation protein SMC [Gemmatimonadales bacterium]